MSNIYLSIISAPGEFSGINFVSIPASAFMKRHVADCFEADQVFDHFENVGIGDIESTFVDQENRITFCIDFPFCVLPEKQFHATTRKVLPCLDSDLI